MHTRGLHPSCFYIISYYPFVFEKLLGILQKLTHAFSLNEAQKGKGNIMMDGIDLMDLMTERNEEMQSNGLSEKHQHSFTRVVGYECCCGSAQQHFISIWV